MKLTMAQKVSIVAQMILTFGFIVGISLVVGLIIGLFGVAVNYWIVSGIGSGIAVLIAIAGVSQYIATQQAMSDIKGNWDKMLKEFD